jgi:hypothetical protein
MVAAAMVVDVLYIRAGREVVGMEKVGGLGLVFEGEFWLWWITGGLWVI